MPANGRWDLIQRLKRQESTGNRELLCGPTTPSVHVHCLKEFSNLLNSKHTCNYNIYFQYQWSIRGTNWDMYCLLNLGYT